MSQSLAGANVSLSGNLFVRYAIRKILSQIQHGRLIVGLPDGQRIDHRGSQAGPEADIDFRNWRAVRRLALEGDIGFGASFVEEGWRTSNLTALIELAAQNSSALMAAVTGSAPFRAVNWVAHRLRANTRAGSRNNVEAHYDLGNEFYRLWLDSGMIYSSALYTRSDMTLEQAQEAKLERIIDRLGVKRGASVLEIGCGWGALATRLAERAGAKVRGLTISPAQLGYAKDIVRQKSLSERVDLRLQDYRDSDGLYDRIVSIEMLEAVGRDFLPDYFSAIRARLAPGGLCVLQTITIAESRFAEYCRNPDFIQRYIFPGGFLPTKALLREKIEAAGLKLIEVENFGQSYALTLREWRRRFFKAWPEIERLGFKPSFRRLWEYYLCYCEAGFSAGALDVGLYSIVRKA